MCNLGQGIAEENMRKGIEKGRAEGSKSTFINNLRNLMESLNWSIDQAMAALRVPEEERPKYRELLGQQ